MKFKLIYFCLIIGLLALASCAPELPASTPETPTETTEVAEIINDATPLPEEEIPYPPPPPQDTEPQPYPPPTVEIVPVDVYPGPDTADQTAGGPAFKLDKPINEGTTEITGTGPADVPILILDVTFMGEILGDGVIGADGTFSIQVEALEKDHRIGIALDNLEGTQWTEEDFYGTGFNGDESMQVPMVGYFFDTAMVSE